jgi:hypothetical protein
MPGGVSAAGQIIAGEEDANSIYRMDSNGVSTLITNAIISPEGVHFIPSQVCALDPNAQLGTFGAGALFVSGISQNKIFSFPASLFANLTGGIVITETAVGYTGTIEHLLNDGTVGARLWEGDGSNALEGSAFNICDPPPPPAGCTLTQGGYKNNFNKLLLLKSPAGLTLGTVFYTNAQLNGILQNNAIQGNGLLSLAHQLLTAKLNIFYGADPTTVVSKITAADALIGSLKIPGSGLTPTGFLPTWATSAVENALDMYNNGLTPGGPPHCVGSPVPSR